VKDKAGLNPFIMWRNRIESSRRKAASLQVEP
jgi:hypothetical protein